MSSNFMAKMRFGLSVRMGIYERVQAYLEANIGIVDTLVSIRDRYARKNKNDFRAYVISQWIHTMERGGKFGDAIQEWIPPSEHMLIAAGERGSGLIQGLQEAVILSQAASRNKAAIIGGLLFPCALFGMEIGLLIMFQTEMVPVFKGLLALEKWPASAQTLDAISSFLYRYLWLVLAGFIGLFALIGSTFGSWTGFPRKYLDAVPPWSIYRGYQASSFLIGLSSLMKAGVANYDAIRLMHKNASPWMKNHLEKMMNTLRLGGNNPGLALDTGLLDAETMGDVEDYGKLSSFQEAINILGARSLEKGVKQIEARMAIIKNVMLVFVAMSIVGIYYTSYGLQTVIAESSSRL